MNPTFMTSVYDVELGDSSPTGIIVANLFTACTTKIRIMYSYSQYDYQVLYTSVVLCTLYHIIKVRTRKWSTRYAALLYDHRTELYDKRCLTTHVPRKGRGN